MDNEARNQEEEQTQRRARLLQFQYYDVRSLEKLPLFEGVLSNQDMYQFHAVVLTMEEGRMVVGITTKTPQQTISTLRDRFSDHKVSYVMMSEAAFKDFMLLYDPPPEVSYDDIKIKPTTDEASLKKVSETIASVKPEDIFNYLIRQANYLNASDIHLETQENDVRIRFRVDGVMHQIASVTTDKYRQLASAIAIHANISTSSPDPQTGHMNHKILDDDGNVVADVNMRIETIQTLYGQDAVIRLFAVGQELLALERLGLNDRQKNVIEEIVSHPRGLVLAVGPTGSGKTTTLYSILTKLNSPERKIITLEDPVEYSLDGVIQIPVESSHKKSFAESLRAVLRLDPDVIMIGEIRDIDTAKTALQASLSGHLVLSTFHAADTTTALARLREFIGDNPLFTSAIRAISAQRLVRRLDEKSKTPAQLDDFMKNKIVEAFAVSAQDISPPDVNTATFYSPVRTDESPFGYQGQIAVMEIMTMNPRIEELLHRDAEHLDVEEIRKAAIESGMVTMLQDAISKASEGVTSLEEVYRVVS